MNDEERKRLAETRRLIFTNLANGVPVEGVMEGFHLSEKEVLDHFRFVARKIWGYRFERAQPYIKCETPNDAYHQRRALTYSLDRCGDTYLTSDHRLHNEKTAIMDPSNRGEADDMIEHVAARSEGR
jgi:hypothetical protein